MPWRALPGARPDAYHVWLSEIMLQQTTVAVVIPYFERFTVRFPTLGTLAAAPEGDVMEAWAGLGYYARARNLHACAKQVAALGTFPDTLDGLRALPGIGLYTAAAVASIAFGRAVVPVDGNVERVVARLYAITEPLPGARRVIARGAAQLGADAQARARPADFTQALFDLGATLCTPRSPACVLCPWRTGCLGHAQGIAATLPVKAPRPVRPVRHGAAFVLRDAEGAVLLRRRPPSGLLGGMMEVPNTAWRAGTWPAHEALAEAPCPADWRLAGVARHVFTHFELRLDVYSASVTCVGTGGVAGPALAGAALPSLMRRCLAVAGTAL